MTPFSKASCKSSKMAQIIDLDPADCFFEEDGRLSKLTRGVRIKEARVLYQSVHRKYQKHEEEDFLVTFLNAAGT